MPTLDREFTVGPLSFQLEPGTAFVRAIRFHGHEALRGIYPAVRDEFWGTLPAGAGPAEAEIAPDLVRLRITGQLQHTATGLEWEADISARSDGTLRYHWRGRARWTFRTNRTGLCVLHPAEAAGAPCRVEHADGRSVSGWLPTAIAPHQPFTDLRAVAHTFGGGAEAIVRFEGETFEMEDQRNWSDASFKTYCRPLARPRPYEVKAGEVIEHVATLTLRGRPGVETDRAAALAPIGALPRTSGCRRRWRSRMRWRFCAPARCGCGCARRLRAFRTAFCPRPPAVARSGGIWCPGSSGSCSCAGFRLRSRGSASFSPCSF